MRRHPLTLALHAAIDMMLVQDITAARAERAAERAAEPRTYRAHDLYRTGDADAPLDIQDRNGEVTLGLCRRCGQAEGDLTYDCPGELRHTLDATSDVAENRIEVEIPDLRAAHLKTVTEANQQRIFLLPEHES